MAGVIVTTGCERFLALFANIDLVGSDIFVGLFKSAHTPVPADVLATYTAIENTFPGYARANISTGAAPPVNPDGTGGAVTTAVNANFAQSGATAEKSFGYFVFKGVGGILIGAELFSVPFDWTTSGPSLAVSISFFEDPA